MRKILILGLFSFWALLPITADAQAVPTFEDGSWVMPIRAQRPVEAQSGGSYEEMIYEVCATEGCAVSPETMIRVMNCESGGSMDAVAYNPESGNNTYGIFQIDGMWGGGGMSAREQIEFAANHLGVDVNWSCL